MIIRTFAAWAIILSAAAPVLGQEPLDVAMSVFERDYYPSIIQLSAGPYATTDIPGITALRYRAAVTISEIYSTLFVEAVAVGQEGCCLRVLWARRVDLALTPSGRLRGLPGRSMSGLMLHEWTSPNSFVLTIRDRRYEAVIGGEEEFSVRDITN
ncbi:MAG: hypothetical protein IIB38_11425 [Candidatus Hydrogenedentes bacterium]|nr:hypothetical protein [Candidatus Hydrogenedentota bacterium]